MIKEEDFKNLVNEFRVAAAQADFSFNVGRFCQLVARKGGAVKPELNDLTEEMSQ